MTLRDGLASRWLTCVVGALAGVGFVASPATAHPIDELLQQVYVTPRLGGIDIDVEITPGVKVAADFVRLVDANGDGLIATAEAQAFSNVVQSALALTVNGATVPTQLVDSTYADVALMAAGGGTIILNFTADAPSTAATSVVIVTNSYAPATPAETPIFSKVQANLTPDIAAPVEVDSIRHNDDGRTIVAAYSQPGAAEAQSSAEVSGATRPFAFVAAVLSLIALGIAVVLGQRWRRRRH